MRFTFVRWSSRDRCLFVARDGIGLLPLFATRHGGGMGGGIPHKGIVVDEVDEGSG
ncbi:MAG: hypothetical protein CBARDMAM_5159 [uncultured Caballeronia sp.]|nr:MAG: hypothetical protein CBARDMAM_5159 [uncultured Caballeronia sp.]